MTEIVGVVPAKATSSRLPGKNLKEIGGRPLFLNSALHLARVLPREHVFIDTEDSDIARMAREVGFGVLSRPQGLASNKTSGIDLMQWEIAQLEDFDVIIQHFPTMPFLSLNTLRQMIHAVTEDGFDSAFGIHSSQEYIWENRTTPSYALDVLPNSVELPTTHRECMGIYVTKIESFVKHRNRICGSFKAVSVDHFEMVDIDTQEDFDFADVIARGLPRTNEYLSGFGNEKTAAPKIVFIDVDGTLTDGSITVDSDGRLHRSYSTLDGVAISQVSKQVPVIFITAANVDASISFRASMLGVEDVKFATRDKYTAASEVCNSYGFSLEDALFVGNDHPDLGLLNSSGFAYVPGDSDLDGGVGVTRLSKMAGFGAVREALIHAGLFDDGISGKAKI